jgi:predicted porin
MNKFIFGLFAAFFCMGSFAEDINYGFGIKDWLHIMRMPQGEAMATNGVVVTGSVKYKEYSLNVSSLLLTSYTLERSNTHAQRLDRDIALGYTLSDRYTAFVGYKSIEQKTVGDATGIFYGISTFYPLGDAGHLHGTFAMSNAITGIDGINQDGRYRSVEFGYGYPLNPNTVFGIGYRQQQLITPLSTEYNIGGAIFGLSVNF